MMMRRAASLCALAVVATACTNFDREDQVHDLRVLAIKTEPAEILYSPLFLTAPSQRPPFPLPTVDVDIEVFAFDPRGGHVETSLQLCPAGAGDSTCRLYDPTADLAKEPAAARPEIAALLKPDVAETTIADDATPVGRITPATYAMTFTPAVIDFFIPDDANGNPVPSLFPLFPRLVYQATNTDAKAADPEGVVRERAFKRIPVSLDLTSPDLPPDVVQNFARSLGINLCTSPIPPEEFAKQGRADCLLTRAPNQNPSLVGFKLEQDPANLTPDTLTSDVVTPDVTAAPLLRVDAGAEVSVTPVFAPGTVENYQVVSFDIQASKVILLNRVEDLACNWYVTRGNASSDLTALQFGPTLGVSWQTPPDAKSGERDSLILVVLDQRGGTAVGEVTVEYR
jgi:hypothetical protein